MLLKSIYLHHFRLYKEKFFEFSPDINWVVGPNAIGKTSLLEAIYFLATGQSFRTYQAANLIQLGESSFYLEAHFVKHGIEQTLKISHKSKERSIVLNATRNLKTSSLVGLLPSVIFSPNDVEIIKGAPSFRRQYIDAQLSQGDPLYFYHCSRYQRAMRQRNCLLKAKDAKTIRNWEHEMALSASYLTKKRLKLLNDLNPLAASFYQAIGQEAFPFSLHYKSSIKLADSSDDLANRYLEAYEKNRWREMALAATLIGPHKDDLLIFIGDKEARYFASEGQAKSCAAALRLAEWQSLQVSTAEKPLMLLDDLNASLDQMRLSRLFKLLEPLGQTFITSTDSFSYQSNKSVKLLLL